MMEQFVAKIKGEHGSVVLDLITPDDSIAQMKANDMIYGKSGLGRRPTSAYRATILSE